MALHGERQPLLVPRADDEYDDQDEELQLPQDSFVTSDRVTVFVLLTLVIVTKSVGSSLYSSAISSVEYAINCHQFRPNVTDAPPFLCDSHEADAEFVHLSTWKNNMSLLASLLTAVPYGIAADRFSRRNLLALSIGGILLSTAGEIIICLFPNVFPLRLVWLTSFFTSVGGGSLVFTALVNAIASDVSSNAQRVIVFFFAEALTTMSFMLSRPLYSALEVHNPWLAIYISLATMCITTVMILFLPSTRDIASLTGLTAPNDPSQEASNTFKARLYLYSRRAARRVVFVSRLVTIDNKRLGLILLGSFFFIMSYYTPALTVGYLFQRLKWSSHDAFLVNIIRLWCNLVVVALIFPITSRILQRLRYNPVEKDLWLARSIILTVVAGLLITGFSSGKAMVIIGTVLVSPDSAFIPVARSLLVLFNGERHTGVLFSLVAAVQSLALLVGLPVLSWLFTAGVNWGAGWYSLPFIVLAVLTAVAGGSVANVRVRESDAQGPQRNTQDDV